MHDHRTIVDQHPSGVGGALLVQRIDAVFVELLQQVVDDGLGLPLTSGRRDDEVIRKDGYGSYVKEEDVASLLVRGYVYGFASQFD